MVRNDKPILRDILDKSVTTIAPKIKKEIYKKWAINVTPEIEYKKYIIIIFAILLFIILILLYQHYYLKKKIKEATKKIKEKNENFKRIMDNAMEAVIISDENLMILDANKTAEKIFGYKLEEVKGKSLLEFTPKDEQNELFNNYERLEPVEIVRKRKDGSQIVCLATRTFFIENSKKYRVSMLVDITKFKKQEEMLAQQSKSVAMGEMIGNIAHQWRQPLNALSLYISNLVLDYEFKELNDEKIKEFEEHTNRLIQGMSQTITDFTNFLKPDKIKKEFSLIECLNDSIKFIEASYKVNEIEIENNIKKDIKLFGVKSELEQVFMNIFNNSKDAFKERKIENRKVIISAEEENNKVIIKFKDNAGGVDEKIINRLTEPYFSTKFANQGTGVGLYMSDMIIRNTFNGKFIMKNIENGLETKIIVEKK
jgi:PAS domain S-box-containing protein